MLTLCGRLRLPTIKGLGYNVLPPVATWGRLRLPPGEGLGYNLT